MRNRDVHKKLRQAFAHAAPQAPRVTPLVAQAVTMPHKEAPCAAKLSMPWWALAAATAVVVLFCAFMGTQLKRETVGPISVTSNGASAVATIEPTPEVTPTDVPPQAETGRILLVGTRYGNRLYLDRALSLWQDCYERGIRDLFIEHDFAIGAFLNRWMQADSDEILDQLIMDLSGSGYDSAPVWDFYRAIKATCPETVFHGVDIGYYSDTGWRYIHLLEAEGKQNSHAYDQARENLKQGRAYYAIRTPYQNRLYRDSCLATNFIESFTALGGQDVMGIFNCSRVSWEGEEKPYPEYETMLDLLAARYPDTIEVKEYSPVMEVITIGGREYAAEYGGEFTSTREQGYLPRRIWRVKGAYEDFKDAPLTGDYAYCMVLFFPEEIGCVYVADITTKDGSVIRIYMRTDGNEKDNYAIAELFEP